MEKEVADVFLYGCLLQATVGSGERSGDDDPDSPGRGAGAGREKGAGAAMIAIGPVGVGPATVCD